MSMSACVRLLFSSFSQHGNPPPGLGETIRMYVITSEHVCRNEIRVVTSQLPGDLSDFTRKTHPPGFELGWPRPCKAMPAAP